MGSLLVLPFFSGEPLFMVLLILSMLLSGFFNALWKEPVMVLGGKRLILLRSLFVMPIVLGYSIFSGFGSLLSYFSLGSPSFWGLILISLFSYPGLYFFVKAVKSGPISLVVPTCSIAVIAPILYGIVFLSEGTFNEFSIGGLAMIVAGLLLLKFRYSNGRIVYMGDAGFRYSLFSIFLLGSVFISSINIAYSAGPSATLLVQEGSVLILAFLHILISRMLGRMRAKNTDKVPYRWTPEQLRHHWKHYKWIIATIGIMSGFSVVFRMISFQAPLPMATTILSFSSLVSVVVAMNYYGENLKGQQKAAVAFLIAGIFIVSWIGDGQADPFGFFFSGLKNN
jgi:drug/metabolite transporter (DMT)-like permease